MPPELDPLAAAAAAARRAERIQTAALALLCAWTQGKAGEADEVLIRLAASTARELVAECEKEPTT